MIRFSYSSRIPQIALSLDERIDGALRIGAEGIASAAQTRAPVATGALRDAIHVEKITEGEYAVVAGDDDVFYAHIIEGGGVNTAPRPFLIPALEAERDNVLADINRVLGDL